MHHVITDTTSLAQFCDALAHETYVTVDTEFLREKTYYAQLCLVQVAGAELAAAIDPLAPGIDLQPLYALLANPNVLKVFHACRQDMEIFHHAMPTLPTPVFDTQIAASACGFGESVSYEMLVNKISGQSVDKSSRFTDWSRRPLSDKQVTYALQDVLFLRPVYEALAASLRERKRETWIAGDMAQLADPKIYDVAPDDAWRKLRLRQTSPRFLARAQAAARWREMVAQARNVPRSRIMKDETLAEVAQANPADMQALQAIRGFYASLSATHYEALFTALETADALPSSDLPRLPAFVPLTPQAEALADILRLFLKLKASDAQVVPRLLAEKSDIEALASGKREGLSVLEGWRYEVFGKQAIALLEGRIAMRVTEEGLVFEAQTP